MYPDRVLKYKYNKFKAWSERFLMSKDIFIDLPFSIFKFSKDMVLYLLVYLGPYFPAFGLNTERKRYSIPSVFSPKAENTDQKKLRIWTLFRQWLGWYSLESLVQINDALCGCLQSLKVLMSSFYPELLISLLRSFEVFAMLTLIGIHSHYQASIK